LFDIVINIIKYQVMITCWW